MGEVKGVEVIPVMIYAGVITAGDKAGIE